LGQKYNKKKIKKSIHIPFNHSSFVVGVGVTMVGYLVTPLLGVVFNIGWEAFCPNHYHLNIMINKEPINILDLP